MALVLGMMLSEKLFVMQFLDELPDFNFQYYTWMMY